MKSQLLFEVETLREMLKASIEVLDEIDRTHSGLTAWGRGYLEGRADVLKHLDRILKEVNE